MDFARRKAKPRFHADENFPELATAIPRAFKANVLTMQEARRRGHPDENHTAEAFRLGRVFITCDRDYLDKRRFPLIHCPPMSGYLASAKIKIPLWMSGIGIMRVQSCCTCSSSRGVACSRRYCRCPSGYSLITTYVLMGFPPSP